MLPAQLRSPWRTILHSYKNVDYVRWLTLGILVGVFSGVAAVLFFISIEFIKTFLLHHLAGIEMPALVNEEVFHLPAGSFRPWLVPIFTTATGLITGLLVSKFIPETVDSGTDGTDAMIKSFHRNEGYLRPLVPIIKGATAVLTIASGGSAGREGPISQIGAGIGSFLANKLKLSVKERRILLLAGAAGGLGAIFRAPLGGAITAVEVIYMEDFESEAILPSVLSSVVAYTIFSFTFGNKPIFDIPTFHFRDGRELIFYAILALFCTATGWFYIKTFRFLKFSIFGKIREKAGITAAMTMGGLCMGMLGMAVPQVLTGGYGWLQEAILGNLPIAIMLLVILTKTVATSFTLGSGMSGGMFAPALFVGGVSGGVIGKLAHTYFPDIATQPGGYVLVGMAAFFACVAHAPVGPLLMVCEITQGYGLLAPLMLASALCLVMGRKLFLYDNQVDNKFESPAHIKDATINILEQLQVRDFFRPGRVTTLEEGTTLKALVDIIAGTNEFCFPVKNEAGELTGILTIQDVREVLFEDSLYDVILVKELARKPIVLYPHDDLYQALLSFVDTDLGQLPVVDHQKGHKVLGMINREDVFKAYSHTIKTLEEE